MQHCWTISPSPQLCYSWQGNLYMRAFQGLSAGTKQKGIGYSASCRVRSSQALDYRQPHRGSSSWAEEVRMGQRFLVKRD